MLGAGTRIGPYEVVGSLGVGGMGEVYRATDTNLHRPVAIKVLPEAVASDPERLARFDREAKTLAALNHPHIAQIYGLERGDGQLALVMELVEGPTLADRIAHGAIPFGEALPMAKQVAEALEAAHEQGIVHRDLKPANIKVRPDGTVKVLDFGLAKAIEPAGAGASPVSASLSPTITTPAMTQMGMILGTAAYMSPEQARGKPVDRRTDIWAFGCVLYEMLTGQRAFEAEDVSMTLSKVLQRDPDFSALPASLPPAVRVYVTRCLEKDPRRRVGDIHDVRLALDGAFDLPDAAPAPAVRQRRVPSLALAAGAVLLLAAGIVVGRSLLLTPAAPGTIEVVRATLPLDAQQALGGSSLIDRYHPMERAFVLSPDGRQLAYVASAPDGGTRILHVRALGQAASRPIAGTEGVAAPFFSPDGTSIGFFVGSDLKRVSVTTGEVRTVATDGGTFQPWGASWTSAETILLGGEQGIFEVPSSGGHLVQKIANPDGSPQALLYPTLLPGGRAMLFTVGRVFTIPSQSAIVVQSLDTGMRRVIVEGGSDPVFVPTGHILFVRTGTLMAVPFDLTRLEATGDPVVVVEDVMQAEHAGNGFLSTGAGQYSVTTSGALAYVPGGVYPDADGSLLWVDRDGAASTLPLPSGPYQVPRLSPDGTKVAYRLGFPRYGQVWVYDLERNVPLKLTTGGDADTPVWSQDGRKILFVADSPQGRAQIMSVDADGSRPAEVVARSAIRAEYFALSSLSPDNELAVVSRGGDPAGVGQADNDILTLAIGNGAAPSPPKPFVATPARERSPAFSPDGRWLAYVSDQTGRDEVYVRAFPAGDGLVRVSTNGGRDPVWSRNGSEIFYRQPSQRAGESGQMVVVGVTAGPRFGAPRTLFADSYGNHVNVRAYDVAPDGRRFLMRSDWAYKTPPVTSINLVLNWFEELKRLAPTR